MRSTQDVSALWLTVFAAHASEAELKDVVFDRTMAGEVVANEHRRFLGFGKAAKAYWRLVCRIGERAIPEVSL